MHDHDCEEDRDVVAVCSSNGSLSSEGQTGLGSGKAIQRPNFKMKPLRCVSSQDHLVSFFREQFLVKNYCHVLWVDFNRVQKGALHAYNCDRQEVLRVFFQLKAWNCEIV